MRIWIWCRKCNSRQKEINDKSQCECKKPLKRWPCEEDYAWNPSKCTCECDKDGETDKYWKDCQCMESLFDDVVITSNEIVDAVVIVDRVY